jgi:hypothetical protein
VLPATSAGASFHAGIATGKFQGVMSPTTPTGLRWVYTWPAVRDWPYTSPLGNHPSAAKYRSVVSSRAASPRASRSGLPVSRVISSAMSSARSRASSAAARSTADRSAPRRADQAGKADRAASAAASTSARPESGKGPRSSDGAAGFGRSYVRPLVADTHSPAIRLFDRLGCGPRPPGLAASASVTSVAR